MPSSITFVEDGGSVAVEWTDQTTRSANFSKAEYQFSRNGNTFELTPLGGGINIGQFRLADIASPTYASENAAEAGLSEMFKVTMDANGLRDFLNNAFVSGKTHYLLPVVDEASGDILLARYSGVQFGDAPVDAPVDYLRPADGAIVSPFGNTRPLGGPKYAYDGLQVTDQGGTTTPVEVAGTSKGVCVWTFSKDTGTSGILTLRGSLDGTTWLDIAATTSQVADGSGKIEWTTPYRFVMGVFTTQVGSGSLFNLVVNAV